MATKSRWHSAPLCDSCWLELNGERPVTRLKDPLVELCIWCGDETTSGIFVRAQVTIPVHG